MIVNTHRTHVLRRGRWLPVIFITLASLSGCSVMDYLSDDNQPAEPLPDNSEIMASEMLPTKDQQVDTLLAEWQQMKPSIERLATLEGELNALKAQMKQTHAVAADAKTTAMAASDKVNSAVMDRRSATASNVQSTGSGQGYALQLGAYRDLNGLKSSLQRFQQLFPNLASGRSARVSEVRTGNNTTLLRLKVGPVSSHSQAIQFCAQVKARNIGCIPAQFDGTAL